MKKLWKKCRDEQLEFAVEAVKSEWRHFAETGSCNGLLCDWCPFDNSSLCQANIFTRRKFNSKNKRIAKLNEEEE